MQEKPELRKWSELHGIAVVSIASGKKVGTVENFYFDPNTNEVPAFVIRLGLFSKRVLLTKSITAIGADAITFPDENLLIKENEDKQLGDLSLGHGLLSYRILSEGGNVVGNVGNILLDTATASAPRVHSFELAGGLRSYISGKYPSFDANQVTRHGKDVMVIPDMVADELQRR